jgi:GNAT superfamily N-acetyltransferase
MTLILRQLERAEMAAAALIHRAAFDERLPWLAGLHTPEQDRAFFCGHVYSACTVWGALDGEMAGFIAWRDGWIEHLFVHPSQQGRGIGSALLHEAQVRQTSLQLWTFVRNTRARRFYEHHGFVACEQTDGSGNEEREPDIRYAWQQTGTVHRRSGFSPAQ